MRTYTIRFVHKISPQWADVETFELPDGTFSDSRTLQADALRDAGAMSPGERLRGFRVEGDKTVCFPDRGIWHALVITPEGL